MAYELPFILWDNVITIDNVSVDITPESGYPIGNIGDWLDWTYWKSGSVGLGPKIDIDKGAAGIQVDTLAVLAHNFGDAGISTGAYIQIYEDDNAGFSSPSLLGAVTVLDNEPFYYTFTSGTQRYNRIWIGSLDSVPYAGVMFLGTKMTMPVGPEFSFDPDRQNVMSERFVSYSGRMVSSAVRYVEREMMVPFRRLAQSFVDSDLLPFLEDHYGQMKPFFFVPDPGDEFGTDKMYYLVAPDNPRIELPVWEDDIDYRNWILRAQGIRQSKFR